MLIKAHQDSAFERLKSNHSPFDLNQSNNFNPNTIETKKLLV